MKFRMIRTPGDYFSVVRILHACGKNMGRKYDLHHWDNPWFKTVIIVILSSFRNRVFVVEDNGKAVATYQTKAEHDTLYFEKLAVLPSKSGKGIGGLCMRQIEEEALTKRCAKVKMDVYSNSAHAKEFYENHGYKIVGVNKTLKYDVICMEKELVI